MCKYNNERPCFNTLTEVSSLHKKVWPVSETETFLGDYRYTAKTSSKFLRLHLIPDLIMCHLVGVHSYQPQWSIPDPSSLPMVHPLLL